jgi:hypothetical protein
VIWFIFSRENIPPFYTVSGPWNLLSILNYTDISEISHVKTTLLIDGSLPRLETICLFWLFGKEEVFRVFRVGLGFEAFRPRWSVRCE